MLNRVKLIINQYSMVPYAHIFKRLQSELLISNPRRSGSSETMNKKRSEIKSEILTHFHELLNRDRKNNNFPNTYNNDCTTQKHLSSGQSELEESNKNKHEFLKNSETLNISAVHLKEIDEGIDKIKKLLCTNTHTHNLLSTIDELCDPLVCQMSHKDILRLLILINIRVDNAMTQTWFYKNSVNKLIDLFYFNLLNVHERVQLLYFICLTKDADDKVIQDLLISLNDFKELSIHEQCILMDLRFKYKLMLYPLQRKSIEQKINTCYQEIISKPLLLLMLCESLKLWGDISNFNIVNYLDNIIINTEDRFNFVNITSIVSYYESIRYVNREVLKRLVNDAMDHITYKNSVQERQPIVNNKTLTVYNSRNLKEFLRCISRLNYNLTEAELHKIHTLLQNHIDILLKNPRHLVNIILSLWILGHKEEEIIKTCFRRKIFENKAYETVKNLPLLLTCIRIEAPHIEIKLNLSKIKVVEVGIKIQKFISMIHEALISLAEEIELSNICIECPIEGMGIYGITFNHGYKCNIHIDCAGRSFCLSDGKLHGMMNLKLRLLKKLGYYSILIKPDQAQTLLQIRKHIIDCIDAR